MVNKSQTIISGLQNNISLKTFLVYSIFLKIFLVMNKSLKRSEQSSQHVLILCER